MGWKRRGSVVFGERDERRERKKKNRKEWNRVKKKRVGASMGFGHQTLARKMKEERERRRRCGNEIGWRIRGSVVFACLVGKIREKEEWRKGKFRDIKWIKKRKK